MRTCNKAINLYAVVVWFEPDHETIEYWNKFANWLPLVVVDNTEVDNKKYSADSISKAKRYINNGRNLGIAKALNQGIEYGLQEINVEEVENSWCIQFDQDSRVDHLFLDQMISEAKKTANKTAAIAPSYFDTNTRRIAPVIVTKPYRVVRATPTGDSPIRASYVISSGCMINLEAVLEVGLHDEALFIDFVDIDWGLRASSFGYHILVLPKVIMTHCLGDKPVEIGNIKLPNHSPLRHFYYFRNVILMLRKTYTPWSWKVMELVKLPVRFMVYALFTKSRRKHIAFMLKGLWHGFRGITGKL